MSSPTIARAPNDNCLTGLWARGASGLPMRILSSGPDDRGWVVVEHPGMPTPTGFYPGRMALEYLEIIPAPVGSA